MAKFYGLGGSRVGSVGNETYYLRLKQNLVRRKILAPYNPRTVKQVLVRIKMKNALLALSNIKKIYDLHSYTNLQPGQTPENMLVSNTINNTTILPKLILEEKDFICFSDYISVSKGNLPLVTDYRYNDEQYYLGLTLSTNGAINDTSVSNISRQLMYMYPNIIGNSKITFILISCINLLDIEINKLIKENKKENLYLACSRCTLPIDLSIESDIDTLGFKVINYTTSLGDTISKLTIKRTYNDQQLLSKTDNKYPTFMCIFSSYENENKETDFSTNVFLKNTKYREILNKLFSTEYTKEHLDSWNPNYLYNQLDPSKIITEE